MPRPTLSQLKDKWFLKFPGTPYSYPPGDRHSDPDPPHISDSTDGNKVTPLIDGATYMGRWRDEVLALALAANPNGDPDGDPHGNLDTEVYMADWRIENVNVLGENKSALLPPSALDVLKYAYGERVNVFVAISHHGGTPEPALNVTSAVSLAEPPTSSPVTTRMKTACLDKRFPFAGSIHQKLVVLKCPDADPTAGIFKAMLGSVDISKSRWDTSEHQPDNDDRPSGLTHDTGVLIEGPAVLDVELTFRERWNDSTSTTGLKTGQQSIEDIAAWIRGEGVKNPSHETPQIELPLSTPQATDKNHSVQILRTYGIVRPDSKRQRYSWSAQGEFTIWASYLNAIKIAQDYIYIEDQYLFPFGYPPYISGPPSPWREADIVYQLGEAIKRGVRVVATVPGKPEDLFGATAEVFQRDLGVTYLNGLATQSQTANNRGDLVCAKLAVPDSNGADVSVYVHSKLLICDDEFVLIGSANVNRRSMTNDGEIAAGIVDGDGAFAQDLRTTLWAEHLEIDLTDPNAVANLADPATAFTTFKNKTTNSQGRVRTYTPGAATPVPKLHGPVFNLLVDPYAGPPL